MEKSIFSHSESKKSSFENGLYSAQENGIDSDKIWNLVITKNLDVAVIRSKVRVFQNLL